MSLNNTTVTYIALNRMKTQKLRASLTNLHFPLSLPSTNTEILEAIQSLKCNKTPGPDGFTSEFYKKIATELSPLLQAMFN